jgi:serine/alanine adding enzyme
VNGRSDIVRVLFGDQYPNGLPSPDVYFTRGYGRAASVTDCGEWILLEALEGAWQVPLIVRTLGDGTKDAISPYGYSGVYACPSLSPAQLDLAWAATVTCLKDLGVISVLLRHSPLVAQAPLTPGQRSIVTGHPTILLEPADKASAWDGLASACRNQIRKAVKNGYTGEVRQASSQDLSPGGDFRRLYDQTMHRLDAAPVYRFTEEYYRRLLDGLGSDLFIADVRNELGAVGSSMLLMRHGHRLHGHLSGSNWDDARMGANNLLNWIATEFTADQGLRQFHLGGGISQRDGLFKFKRTFGGLELQYGVSALIVDPGLYQVHVMKRADECRTTSEALVASNYFPAYRGGISEPVH